MTFNEMKDMISIMGYTCEPPKRLNDNQYAAYFAVLQDVEHEVFTRVCHSKMSKGFNFFPQAGQLKSACISAIKADEPTGEEMWATLMEEVGSRTTHHIMTPKLEKVVRMVGGVERLGNAHDIKELPWLKKEFISLWEEIEHVESERNILADVPDRKKIVSGRKMLGREPETGIERMLCGLKVVDGEDRRTK